MFLCIIHLMSKASQISKICPHEGFEKQKAPLSGLQNIYIRTIGVILEIYQDYCLGGKYLRDDGIQLISAIQISDEPDAMLWKFVRSNGVSSSPSLYKTVILGSCSNMSICLLFGALLLTVLNRDNVSEMSRVYSLWKWKRSVIFSLKIQPKRSGGGPDLRTSGSFLGRRLPLQTNTSFFCTICPHS